VRKFRVIPAVLVSKRNDEISLARVTALTQAGRDFGFDTIYDLRVEGHIIVRKINICLRDDGQSKKYDEGSEKHIDKLPGNDSDWKSRVGWGLARQVGHPARLNLPTQASYLQGRSHPATPSLDRSATDMRRPGDTAYVFGFAWPIFPARQEHVVVSGCFASRDNQPRNAGTQTIEDILAAGENERVEFKASARWDYPEGKANKALEQVIVKTVAGFLNSKDGGILVIGVEDNGNIMGLENNYRTLSQRPNRDGYQQFLVNLLSNSLGKVPCSSVSIEFSAPGNNEVCVVNCSASSAPVYVQDGQQSKFYLRVGNTTQELNTKDSVAYIDSRW